MKDLYAITDRYGDITVIHSPDRVRAVQAWEEHVNDDEARTVLRGNGAVRRFLEGGHNKLKWGDVRLQAVTIKETK